MGYFKVGSAEFEVLWQTVDHLRCDCAPMSCFVQRLVDKSRHVDTAEHAIGNFEWEYTRSSDAEREGKVESYILQHNLQPSILAWAQQVLLEGPVFRTLCRREQFVLILRYAYMKQIRGIDSVQQRVIFQYDQGVDRCPAGVGVAPCICPKGKYWDSSRMRPFDSA